MRLYLDDNSNDPILAAVLRKAGHTVVCPGDVSLAGVSDARHLEHAIREQLVLLTADREDFGDLHALVLTSGGSHPALHSGLDDERPGGRVWMQRGAGKW